MAELALKTFIIYAHEDLEYKIGLEKFLRHLVRKKKIVLWSDIEIKPGELWNDAIQLNLGEAEVILMLVSVDFYNSDYIQDEEFAKAKLKFDAGETLLVPILVRYCPWKSYDLIKDLQALPTGAKSIDKWQSRDEAFTVVAEKIELLADALLKKKAEKWADEQRREAANLKKQQQEQAKEKAETIRHQKDEAAWEQVKTELAETTTFEEKIEILKAYLAHEHFSNHDEEADAMMHKLTGKLEMQQKLKEKRLKDADDAAWQTAFQTDTIEGFEKYLAKAENQLHRTEAERRLEILKEEKRKAAAKPKNGEVKRDHPDTPEMVFVEGGTFQMGSNEFDHTKPVRDVTVPSFWMGKYPVTFEEYDAYCQATGTEKPSDGGWGRGRRPVINVNWHDAEKYCQWLSQKTGTHYRLPSEAEWEFAARGGTISKNFKFAGSDDLNEVGWFRENAGSKTHPVGEKKANELGIHDMSGNVWEWCADLWHNDYKDAPADGSAWLSGEGENRVLRGGGWSNYPFNCRAVIRINYRPDGRDHDFGLRLAAAGFGSASQSVGSHPADL